MKLYLTIETHTKETLTKVVNILLDNNIFDFKINAEVKTTQSRDSLGFSNIIHTTTYQVLISKSLDKLLDLFQDFT